MSFFKIKINHVERIISEEEDRLNREVASQKHRNGISFFFMICKNVLPKAQQTYCPLGSPKSFYFKSFF